MPRTALVRSPVGDRRRLEAARELLDWVYSDESSDEEVALRFLALWFRFHRHELDRKLLRSWRRLISQPGRVDWATLRKELCEYFQLLPNIAELKTPKGFEVPDRIFGARPGLDGRWCFGFGAGLGPPDDADTVRQNVIGDIAELLSGFSLEVVGRCAQCGRVFLRLRAGRRKYCSPKCKYLGAPSTQRGRVSSRPAARAGNAARTAKR